MRHLLSLAAGTLPEFQPHEVAVAGGQAGFSHVGCTIEPDKWNRQSLQATQSALRTYDLSVLDVEVVWIPEGGQLDDGHRLVIEAGLELGAANVLVVSSEPDKGRSADAIHQLCEWVTPGGMRIALEFLMITAVRSMTDALDIIARANHPAAALLVDTLHFQRAGHRPEDLAGVDPSLLPYTQVCDGNLACEGDFQSYLTDAIDLRSVPGEGELPVRAMLQAMPDKIPVSLEIRSRAYRERYPDAAERAAEIRSQALSYFERSGLSII